jgi:hypothetical protein
VPIGAGLVVEGQQQAADPRPMLRRSVRRPRGASPARHRRCRTRARRQGHRQ